MHLAPTVAAPEGEGGKKNIYMYIFFFKLSYIMIKFPFKFLGTNTLPFLLCVVSSKFLHYYNVIFVSLKFLVIEITFLSCAL